MTNRAGTTGGRAPSAPASRRPGQRPRRRASGRRTRAACRRGRPRGRRPPASAHPREGATARLRRRARQLVLERARAKLELRAFRQRPAAEREPPWLLRGAHVTRGQRRVVGAHRPHPDGDRIRGRAQLVHPSTALLAGDPARARDGHPPVERHCDLVGDERPPLGDPDAPGLVLQPRLPRDRRPLPPPRPARSRSKPLPFTFGFGSLGRGDHLRHARGDDRIGARRRGSRDASTARATRKASPPARVLPPARAPRPRHAASRRPAYQPSPTTSGPRTSTAPTSGCVCSTSPRPRSASSSARSRLTRAPPSPPARERG